MNPNRWPELKDKLTAVFKTRTRAEWCELMEGSDVCFAPVLDLEEAPNHLHNQARGTFVELDGVVQPAPTPRFSRTAPTIQRAPAWAGEHTEEVLTDWGLSADEIAALKSSNAIQ